MKFEVKNNKSGFTLVELMFVVAILAFILVGMVQLFIQSSIQAEMSGNITLAMADIQDVIEDIRSENFDDIVTNYSSGGSPGNTFGLSGLNGIGVIYIDDSVADLLQIKVTASWENKYGRIIGEDTNLNGVVDAGEDVNANSELDSPATIITLYTRR